MKIKITSIDKGRKHRRSYKEEYVEKKRKRI